MRLNIDALEPWDLTLEMGGRAYATQPPTWAHVIELEALERARKAGLSAEQTAGLEESVRGGVLRFVGDSPEAVAAVNALKYDMLLPAFAACSGYFEAWLKKKQASAIAAVRPAAAAPLASQAAKPRPG